MKLSQHDLAGPFLKTQCVCTACEKIDENIRYIVS